MLGQIKRGSSFGDWIYNISLRKDISLIVEIGTWNGQGSTRCVFDALISRHDNCKLYSLEASPEMFREAKKYWDSILIPNKAFANKLELIHGRLIELDDLMTIDSIREEKDYKKEWDTWLSQDINNISSCPNVLNLLPLEIDFLILDGGEFSTLSEFKILKSRSKIIACDDTVPLKSREIRKILMNDDNFICLADDLTDRNGYCIFERK